MQQFSEKKYSWDLETAFTSSNMVQWPIFLFSTPRLTWCHLRPRLLVSKQTSCRSLHLATTVCPQIVMRHRINRPHIVLNTVPTPDSVPPPPLAIYFLCLLKRQCLTSAKWDKLQTKEKCVWTAQGRMSNLSLHWMGHAVVVTVTWNLFSPMWKELCCLLWHITQGASCANARDKLSVSEQTKSYVHPHNSEDVSPSSYINRGKAATLSFK